MRKRQGGKYLKRAPEVASSFGAATLGNVLYWFATIIYLELVLCFGTFGAPGTGFLMTMGFSFVFACIFAFLNSFIPQKGNFTFGAILTFFLIFLYGSQMVYFFVFKSLYTVAQMKMGADAVTSFWRETLITMWRNLPWLFALLVPAFVLLLLRKKFWKIFSPSSFLWRILLAVIIVTVHLATVFCLKIGGTGYFTNYYFYYIGPEKLKENFDVLMAAILKAKPATAKGQYLKSVAVASTMGPGIKINASKIG